MARRGATAVRGGLELEAARRSDDGSLASGLDPITVFLRLLWSLDHELRTASKRMEARHGVTGRQRFALRMLRHAPGLSAGQLAELLQIDPSTLTGVLRRLEEQGLLRRSPDASDTRRVSLELSDAGRLAEAPQDETVEAAVRSALGRCRTGEIRGAKAVLGELLSELRGRSLLSRPRAGAPGPGGEAEVPPSGH